MTEPTTTEPATEPVTAKVEPTDVQRAEAARIVAAAGSIFSPDPATDASTARRPVSIDLDALEREGAALPFDFVLGGRRYLMSDPKEVDWQDLISAMANPLMFFRLVLPPEDRSEFFTTKLATWKMDKLINAYLEHYGLPNLPNAAGLPR